MLHRFFSLSDGTSPPSVAREREAKLEPRASHQAALGRKQQLHVGPKPPGLPTVAGDSASGICCSRPRHERPARVSLRSQRASQPGEIHRRILPYPLPPLPPSPLPLPLPLPAPVSDAQESSDIYPARRSTVPLLLSRLSVSTTSHLVQRSSAHAVGRVSVSLLDLAAPRASYGSVQIASLDHTPASPCAIT
ncbi:hypothetical protein VTN00DRAFT_284 [Thermoascus crustaceus]|uniref:uncharacterized protein n=1 Tax=Thermoascus crustaceus TaxID=5088 RepID=UPI00374362DD